MADFSILFKEIFIFIIVNGFMVHILVVLGTLWLTLRLLQWGEFFHLDGLLIKMNLGEVL